MSRIQTLHVLLEKEQGKRDEAQAAVRTALEHFGRQQAQGEGLTNYRGEYVAKWSAQFQRGTSIEILRSYQGFMQRLDQAITQQQALIANAQRNVDAAKARLVQREIRVATVERLIKRRVELLARIQSKRDQKNLDEMAARRTLPKELAGMA